MSAAKRASERKLDQSRAHLCIRRARPKDGRGILQCLRAAFAPFESTYNPEAFLDTVLTQATLTERMAAMSVWVALDEAGKVIGTLACGAIGDGEGHLRGMAVAPSWQGRGVAEELFRATEGELQRSGCSLVTLDTTAPLERARRFYEKHGFRPTGKVTDLFGMPLTEHAKVLIRRRGRARTQRGRKSARRRLRRPAGTQKCGHRDCLKIRNSSGTTGRPP